MIDNNKSNHKHNSCMAKWDSCFIIFESLIILLVTCFPLFFVCSIYNVLSLVSTGLKRVDDNALPEYSLSYGLLGTMEGCVCIGNNTCLVLYCFSYQTRSVQSEPLQKWREVQNAFGEKWLYLWRLSWNVYRKGLLWLVVFLYIYFLFVCLIEVEIFHKLVFQRK